MNGRKWVARTMVMVTLLLAGCKALDIGTITDSGRDRVISGPLTEVAHSTGQTLHHMGMQGGGVAAFIDDEGEAMTVKGTTKAGQPFHVLLRKTWNGATRARVVWEGAPDDTLGQEILKELAASRQRVSDTIPGQAPTGSTSLGGAARSGKAIP